MIKCKRIASTTIKWKRITSARVDPPARATPGAAGYDLRWHPTSHDTQITLIIYPGQLVWLETGFAVRVPDGYVGRVEDRSGRAGSGLTTRAGTIDTDYRSEIMVLVTNESENERPIKLTPGERIAQILFLPCLTDDSELVDSLDDTDRGTNGFGSTGD